MTELAFDIAAKDLERQQRLVNLGDGKTYRVRRRNFALDKQFEEMRQRMDDLDAENEKIQAENEEIIEANAKPGARKKQLKQLKEDALPYEDVCIALEDVESGESPPHSVLEDLDIGWIEDLRKLIWPERAEALGKLLDAAAAARTSQADGGSTPTPAAPTSAA